MKFFKILLFIIIFLMILFLFKVQAQVLLAATEQDSIIYRSAKEAIYKQEWKQAIQYLENFQKDYSGSRYFIDSLYWLAFCINRDANISDNRKEKILLKEKALEKLDRLISKFENSEWLDDALTLKLKISLDFINLGIKRYKSYIENIIQKQGNKFKDLKMVGLNAMIQYDKQKATSILEEMIITASEPSLIKNARFILQQHWEKGVRPYCLTPEKKPELTRMGKLVYPKRAYNPGVDGKVLLSTLVDESGKVINAVPIEGHVLLRRSARRVVMRNRYKPYLLNGKPVRVKFSEIITFEINDQRQP